MIYLFGDGLRYLTVYIGPGSGVLSLGTDPSVLGMGQVGNQVNGDPPLRQAVQTQTLFSLPVQRPHCSMVWNRTVQVWQLMGEDGGPSLGIRPASVNSVKSLSDQSIIIYVCLFCLCPSPCSCLCLSALSEDGPQQIFQTKKVIPPTISPNWPHNIQMPKEKSTQIIDAVLPHWPYGWTGPNTIAMNHKQQQQLIIEKRRGLSPGGWIPPSFIHQVIIITGLNKLYDCMLSPWRWPEMPTGRKTSTQTKTQTTWTTPTWTTGYRNGQHQDRVPGRPQQSVSGDYPRPHRTVPHLLPFI